MTKLLASVPDAWGPKFETIGGAATRTRTGPNQISFVAPVHMALVMLTPQPNREVALNSDRKSRFLAPAGTIEIVPANSELFARWATYKENVLIGMTSDRLQQLAGLEFDTPDFEFHSANAGMVDERALMLAELIRDEFQNKDHLNELYMDSLITVFSTYLLRHHSSLQKDMPVVSQKGGLTTRNWNRVSEYINAHLATKLSISELASVAGLSPTHFLRAFRETARTSPHQYVLRLRLSQAAHLILSTALPLATIAKQVGFGSHSHMSTTMLRAWSISPSSLRE